MLGCQYSKEEKIAFVEEFKTSGMSVNAYSKEKGIPSTTFRGWLRIDRALEFGEIDLGETVVEGALKPAPVIRKAMVFAKDDIRIELKEGYDKGLLRNIVEVLINAN